MITKRRVTPEVYQNWIQKNVIDAGVEVYGQCSKECDRMMTVFPELKKARGYYYCTGWGERTHWWLEDPDGRIVDPTASQFPSKGTGTYVELEEGDPIPSGKCPNCGGKTYDGAYLCSRKCEKEFEEDTSDMAKRA